MSEHRLKVKDFSKPSDQLVHLKKEDLAPLPGELGKLENQPDWKTLTDDAKAKYEATLDDTIAIGIPKPKTKEEEQELVKKFLEGLSKILSKENNWTFLQPLLLSLDHCAQCQTCSEACPIYEASGHNPIYRPTYRSEVFRRIINKYIRPGGKLKTKFTGDIDLNWTTVARLAELAYRCTLCRRCAQTCPVGVDNGLINHEIRKVFSQEMGIVPKEIHDDGSVLQLKVGSSTGMNPLVVKDNIEFIDEDMTDMTGIEIHTPFDKHGADILLIHNAGEIMAWPENPGAFAILFEAAGLSWTLSSELVGYDGINYGLWYDDAQLARVALRHLQIAKKLGVKKIIMGECGHAHKALTVIADRVFPKDMLIPRESAFPLLEEIVMSGKLNLDPSKNDFPVTLHDPCNVVRLMGVVMPQRRILHKIAPQFREMEPHGVRNYCCGGGSGFAIMSGHNFPDWRLSVSGRKKVEQVLNAFEDCLDPSINKYICAPCSNCKGQLRDLINYYDLWERYHITYGGLVELIVNAMVEIKKPFINWEMH